MLSLYRAPHPDPLPPGEGTACHPRVKGSGHQPLSARRTGLRSTELVEGLSHRERAGVRGPVQRQHVGRSFRVKSKSKSKSKMGVFCSCAYSYSCSCSCSCSCSYSCSCSCSYSYSVLNPAVGGHPSFTHFPSHLCPQPPLAGEKVADAAKGLRANSPPCVSVIASHEGPVRS